MQQRFMLKTGNFYPGPVNAMTFARWIKIKGPADGRSLLSI
jgi:hypothetical protein